ncbi:MAG TPA: DUF4194 domain-containing protein [Spirochaetota bacterium]|nr:DUF4194 domain-containing protein [Spirochaetota bacterium]
MEQTKENMLSVIIVTLLKGVIYRDSSPEIWQNIGPLHPHIRAQGEILGLDFFVDEAEGYAFFRQKDQEDEEQAVPRLVQRRQLSYPVSLLCVLLRKKLIEADAGGDSNRVIITRAQVIEMMRIFMPDSGNEAKVSDQIDTALNRVKEMGFVRTLETGADIYEVRRIIRAFFDAERISSLDDKLKEYRNYAAESKK